MREGTAMLDAQGAGSSVGAPDFISQNKLMQATQTQTLLSRAVTQKRYPKSAASIS